MEMLCIGFLIGALVSITSYLLGRMSMYDPNTERTHNRRRDYSADDPVDDWSGRGDSGDNQPTSKEEVINGLKLLSMAMSRYEMSAVKQAIDLLEGEENEEEG